MFINVKNLKKKKVFSKIQTCKKKKQKKKKSATTIINSGSDFLKHDFNEFYG